MISNPSTVQWRVTLVAQRSDGTAFDVPPLEFTWANSFVTNGKSADVGFVVKEACHDVVRRLFPPEATPRRRKRRAR